MTLSLRASLSIFFAELKWLVGQHHGAVVCDDACLPTGKRLSVDPQLRTIHTPIPICGADEVEVHDGGVLGLFDLDGENGILGHGLEGRAEDSLVLGLCGYPYDKCKEDETKLFFIVIKSGVFGFISLVLGN